MDNNLLHHSGLLLTWKSSGNMPLHKLVIWTDLKRYQDLRHWKLMRILYNKSLTFTLCKHSLNYPTFQLSDRAWNEQLSTVGTSRQLTPYLLDLGYSKPRHHLGVCQKFRLLSHSPDTVSQNLQDDKLSRWHAWFESFRTTALEQVMLMLLVCRPPPSASDLNLQTLKLPRAVYFLQNSYPENHVEEIPHTK